MGLYCSAFKPNREIGQSLKGATVSSNARNWAQLVRFDPNQGIVVRDPPGQGFGYWAGAPGVTFDAATKDFYLVYRLRRPRGVEPDRGAEIRIARSRDGVQFEEIWSGRKESLGSSSIERCALTQMPSGQWGLFVSFVDPADGRWRIDLVESNDLSNLDLAALTPILSADDIQAEGVKDPFLFRVAGLYHMIVSYATVETDAPASELHGSHDAYNTGLIKSRTGLATSDDAKTWQWHGEILGPSENGWDRYCARIGTVWQEQGLWLALYDGSADVSENYEEKCGLAYSFDLRHFERVTKSEALMLQPNASGALRYFDVLKLASATYFYYETARSDGSHDLRVFKQSR